MKIALLEPIGVSKEVIDELSAPITEKGHEFVYYDTKTTDPAELAKDVYKRQVRICDRHFLFQICDNILRVL